MKRLLLEFKISSEIILPQTMRAPYTGVDKVESTAW